LGSFRLGTIWQGGKFIAETDLGTDQDFSVDFTEGVWSYVSIYGNHQFAPYFKTDYPLRSQPTDKMLTEFLSFPLPDDKNLLIPCIEFLYRCYGSTSDMARILTTYPWPKVQKLLYADTSKDPSRWLVKPQSIVPDDDGLFLAHALYNGYTEKVAKLLYSELDNAYGKHMKEIGLRVRPWFQGPAKVKVRTVEVGDPSLMYRKRSKKLRQLPSFNSGFTATKYLRVCRTVGRTFLFHGGHFLGMVKSIQ
jgi:hypothetical protein